MAESEEQVQHPETPEEEEEPVSNYKPPAKKTVDEIEKLDEDDESLVKYKQTLLGPKVNPPFPDDDRNVIVHSLSLMIGEDATKTLDLRGDLSKLKEQVIIIKEGASYRLRISFYVQREIVSGLKYTQTVTRKGIRVDKSNCMMGSYGPKSELQNYKTQPEDAPKGLLARGSYTVESKFIDDDKTEILKWTWKFEIKKDWE